MAIKVAPGQLIAPTTPKLVDLDAERVRISHEQKIAELQSFMQQAIAALHAAGVAGF